MTTAASVTPDLILLNGKIHTVDKQNPIAEAVAIGGGKFIEVGSAVTQLKVGDRVCMEPGIPRLDSPATLRGLYNLDPSVR
ncbi:hypothetical protein ACP3WW_23490, partial [Salmonella enterica]